MGPRVLINGIWYKRRHPVVSLVCMSSGPSFSYAAKADFQGQDQFTIQVSGTVVRIAGVSDVKVTVFVVDK